ncbi:MAG: 1-acyl-sn-glycerol-3-phosphate acyltransferase [Holosporaceae bacterium]|jgi:1-acyl-sn-glycerol-3-phosphate acyltransferase|nr:1-acyl-sn-glycerol-3-phosphate acyltransferase [Holosporaceae bacterium]
MHFIRSIIFNTIFYPVTAVGLLLGAPLRFCPKKYVFVFWKYLSLVLNFISTKIGGIAFQLEGKHDPLGPPAIYAMRHESVWETLMLTHLFREPVFVLKKELLSLPLFGALANRTDPVAVDRDNGMRALMEAAEKVKKSVEEGHPVVIFPEGTRTSAGKYVPLKRGIALFYRLTNCPVIPVIHNSGSFWPRRGFMKKPGKIRVIFMEAIAPGLSKEEFMDRLNQAFRRGVEEIKSPQG